MMISSVYARYVIRDFRYRGIPIDSLFEGTTLDLPTLEQTDAIAVTDFNQLLINAESISADPAVGLMIGRNVRTMTLGSVGVAASSAPTLRAGLQVVESFARVHAQHSKINIEATLQGLRVVLQWETELDEVERFHAESGLLWLQNYAELITGRTIQDAHYRLGYPPPSYADAYAKYFRGQVSFNHSVTSSELPAHCLDMPSPYYNRDLWQRFQLSLEENLRELSRSDVRSYSHYVRTLLQSSELPLPTLRSMAKTLHISERTLNRRLQNEGVCFRDLRAEVLASWARRYLNETSDSVESIAASLGFVEASNFRRAFKAWEGCSPNQFRDGQKRVIN